MVFPLGLLVLLAIQLTESQILPNHVVKEYAERSGHSSVPTKYDIVYPRTSHRWRRDGVLDESESSHMTIEAFGDTFNLRLKRSGDFFDAPFVEYCGDGGIRWDAFPVDQDKTCFLSGYLPDVESSLVALKACDGNDVRGWLIGDYTLFLQPIREEHRRSVRSVRSTDNGETPHIAFKLDGNFDASVFKSLSPPAGVAVKKASSSGTLRDGEPKRVTQPLYPEVMVALDKAAMEKWGNDTVPLTLAMMNLVATTYKHPSMEEIDLNLRLVRLILVDQDTCQPFLDVAPDVYDRLSLFTQWARKINVDDENSPLHFDYSFFFTDTKWDNDDVGGLGQIAAMCGGAALCPTYKAVRCLGHEIGHSLGMNHDSEKCPGSTELGYMSGGFIKVTQCNREELRNYFSDPPRCVLDKPSEGTTWPWPGFEGKRVLAGQVFPPDQQCKAIGLTHSYGECPWKTQLVQNYKEGAECLMYCGFDDGTCPFWDWSLEGTACGPGKRCISRKCVCVDEENCHQENGYGRPPSDFAYTPFIMKTDMETAKDICHGHGMSLAKILNRETHEYLVGYLKSLGLDNHPSFHFDGRRYPKGKNVWQTVNGEEMAYFNWDSGEPNNHGGNQECLMLRSKDFTFDDASCDNHRGFICQREIKRATLNGQMVASNKSVAVLLIEPLKVQLTDLTVSVWIRVTGGHVDSLFSYSTNATGDELAVRNLNNMALYVHGTAGPASSVFAMNDGAWHSITVTWSSGNGAWQFFRDDVLISSGVGLAKGHVIPSSGLLSLGRGQNNAGHPWSLGIEADITNFNIWSRVLTAGEVLSLASDCTGSTEGDVVSWSMREFSVQSQIPNHHPVFPSDTCEPRKSGLRGRIAQVGDNKILDAVSTVPRLTEFSGCLWARGTHNSGGWFTYASRGTYVMAVWPKLEMEIDGKGSGFDAWVLDGYWRHVCITWQSSSGEWQVFMDGVKIGNGLDLATGFEFPPGGLLSVGKGKQWAIGASLTMFNFWDRVLPNDEVTALAADCNGNFPGNVVSWDSDLVPLAAEFLSEDHVCAERPTEFADKSVLLDGSTEMSTTNTMPPISAMTACFWSKTTHNSGGWFSYSDGAAYHLAYTTDCELEINAQTSSFENDINTGIWHHSCVSWSSSDGAWQVTVDDVMIGAGSGLATGYQLPAGGKFQIGKNKWWYATGSLAFLNMWDRVLTSEEMVNFGSDCVGSTLGNLVSWNFDITSVSSDKIQDVNVCEPRAPSLAGKVANVGDNKVMDAVPIMPSMTAFSACFWMKGAHNSGGWLTYHSRGTYVMAVWPKLGLEIDGGSSGFNAWILNDHWHHACVTWASTNGEWQAFQDGVRVGNGLGVGAGYTLSAGGRLSVGKGKWWAISGSITMFNFWGDVLPDADVAFLATECEGQIASSRPLVAWDTDLIPLAEEFLTDKEVCGEQPSGYEGKSVAFDGSTEMNTMNAMPLKSALTACFWSKTTHNGGGWFSYSDGAAYRLAFATDCELEVNGQMSRFESRVDDDTWRHTCVSWASSGGVWRVYVDGEEIGDGAGLADGYQLPAGGKFQIGKYKWMYVTGSLAFLNMWARVLTPEEISVLATECTGSTRGDIVSWSYDITPVKPEMVQDVSVCGEHVRACEHQTATLSCPDGRIKVVSANFGRTEREVCGQGSVTDCRAESSLGVVSSRCKDKETCSVASSYNVFGDPCPGTQKYLDVYYRCLDKLPDSGSGGQVVACEGQTATLSCPGGKIRTVSSNYGRTATDVCGWSSVTNCGTDDSFELISLVCDEEDTCDIAASNGIFGDPCPGVQKYLEINYVCEYA